MPTLNMYTCIGDDHHQPDGDRESTSERKHKEDKTKQSKLSVSIRRRRMTPN